MCQFAARPRRSRFDLSKAGLTSHWPLGGSDRPIPYNFLQNLRGCTKVSLSTFAFYLSIRKSSSFFPPLIAVGNLRGAIGLFSWRQSRFRRPSCAMNALAHSAMAARDRQCDRGAGVLPHGLILSSIIVGI